MPDDRALFSLLMITVLAAFVPLLAAKFKRLQVPVVIFEVIAGIMIGKSGFNIVEQSQTLDFLSEFGFVILMFISGLEIDVKSLSFSLERNRPKLFWHAPILLALTVFALTLVTAFSFAFLFKKWGLIDNAGIVGLILSATSLGIVVPILKEREIVSTIYGQAILTSALIADFATLVLLSLTIGIMTKGIVLQLMVFMILLFIFSATLSMGIRIKNLPGLRRLVKGLTTATVQIRTRFSIAFVVAWVALAQALGTEMILGAFLAGVIMSIMAAQDKIVLKEKLDTLGFGFFIPLFFISVGSEFDIRSFLGAPDALYLLPLIVIAAYVVKLLPSLLYWPVFSFRESMAAGFLLSSHLSLTIAASALAFKLGLLRESVNADILILAMITCMISPMLFNKIVPRKVEDKRHGYIIIGVNQHTALLIERLIREGENVSVLLSSNDIFHQDICQKATVMKGDPSDESVLKSLGAEKAAGLVVVLNDMEKDIAVCRLARRRFRIPVVVARADEHASLAVMKALGVRVVQPSLATAIALESALRYPATFDMIAQQTDGVELGEATLLNPFFHEMSLSEVRLPGNALIMGIRRNSDVIVPHGNTTLSLNDVVMLVGNPESIRNTIHILGKVEL